MIDFTGRVEEKYEKRHEDEEYDSPPVANVANTGKKDGVKLEFNEICMISE